jgi:hypothetical protein
LPEAVTTTLLADSTPSKPLKDTVAELLTISAVAAELTVAVPDWITAVSEAPGTPADQFPALVQLPAPVQIVVPAQAEEQAKTSASVKPRAKQ